MEEIIYSVSQLNNDIKYLLEAHFLSIRVEGEISNFSCPSSGHWYFTLKDENAQVRCAMFRLHQHKIRCYPDNGMHMVVHAKVSLYPQRGEYQLIVHHMESIGEGVLQQRFEALKKQLFAEGLFDPRHKKPLPPYPNSIGVITSPTGAAIRDILSVLARRYPLAKVIIYPTLVQGNEAVAGILRMLNLAQTRHECDVLILARGGGSIEDLLCFNDENVARAIFACTLPVVTGIGHEIDFTMADFVADLRAPTPSAAAENSSPDQQTLQQRIQLLIQQLERRHPLQRLLQHQQYLDDLQQRFVLHIQHKIQHKRQQVTGLARELQAFNPKAVLQRGYAIVQKNSQVIKNSQSLNVGDRLLITLAEGEIEAITA